MGTKLVEQANRRRPCTGIRRRRHAPMHLKQLTSVASERHARGTILDSRARRSHGVIRRMDGNSMARPVAAVKSMPGTATMHYFDSLYIEFSISEVK